MAHALREATKINSVEDKQLSQAETAKAETANAQEAAVLNFDKTKSFSRFLEASCDCC